MTQYILRKRIFAVVFLIAIFGFSAVNFVHSYEPLKEKVLEIPIELSDVGYLNPDNMGMMATATTTIGSWIWLTVIKGIIFVANVKDSSVNYLCKSNCDLSAGELIKDASIKSNGNGGGSRMFGQGGGTNSENVDMIIDYVKDKVENI